ncbi:MAG: hypothetical protein ACFFDT_22020, partial [Candidatus Hodarchaeota archaeon]
MNIKRSVNRARRSISVVITGLRFLISSTVIFSTWHRSTGQEFHFNLFPLVLLRRILPRFPYFGVTRY